MKTNSIPLGRIDRKLDPKDPPKSRPVTISTLLAAYVKNRGVDYIRVYTSESAKTVEKSKRNLRVKFYGVSSKKAGVLGRVRNTLASFDYLDAEIVVHANHGSQIPSLCIKCKASTSIKQLQSAFDALTALGKPLKPTASVAEVCPHCGK